MASFDQHYLERLSFSGRAAMSLRQLGEARGRQQLFVRQAPAQLEALRQSAAIESIESSTRIEGITAGPGRVEALVAKGARPQDRSEQEIAGYRDALQLIHDSYEGMRFTSNVVLQLHALLYRYLPNEGGRWKPADNQIVERDTQGKVVRVRFKTTPAVSTPEAMHHLTTAFERATGAHEADPLVLIPLAILDVLCIHPFHDGNGRIARLIMLLLLHRADYLVGRYVSLERIIEDSKDTYYEALERSSRRWHQNKHDAHPWLDYFWGVLHRAYGEFEARVKELTGSKTEQIRRAVERRQNSFNIADIERDCPGVSRDMVRHVLRQMKTEGVLDLIGVGRGARWGRRVPGAPKAPSRRVPRKRKGRQRQARKVTNMSSFDAQIRAAIAGKRLLEVQYHGRSRVVEPHDYGLQKGSVRLLVYQLRSSGTPEGKSSAGWRLFDLAKIEALSTLAQAFQGSRGRWHDAHLTWDELYARVA